MERNERLKAPDKIYVEIDNKAHVYFGLQPENAEEYIRKNALLEWANSWLSFKRSGIVLDDGFSYAMEELIKKLDNIYIMAHLIDADKIRAEIERRKELWIPHKGQGVILCKEIIKQFDSLLFFLDTLQEQENSIYELNQFLINWVRDCQTDAEKDARWEAYRRFFELHDEAMMQEPESDLDEEVEKYFQGLWPGMETAEQCNTDMHFTPPAIMRLASHFYELGRNTKMK